MVFSFVLPYITLIFLAPLGKEQFPFGFTPDISCDTLASALREGFIKIFTPTTFSKRQVKKPSFRYNGVLLHLGLLPLSLWLPPWDLNPQPPD